jgi:hypothetical protein
LTDTCMHTHGYIHTWIHTCTERRFIDRHMLESARKAVGTDEDLLIIDAATVANKRGWEVRVHQHRVCM